MLANVATYGGAGSEVLATYTVCTVLFALPSVGTSALWCGVVVGGIGGLAGAAFLSDELKKEANYSTKITTEINQSNDMLEILSHILAASSVLCGFVGIGMTFYLGRGKGKEVDRLIYGHEISSDSIFYKILRLPNYGWAFASRWFAKRAHLLPIRDQFDKKFQRPFIITHYLFMIGAISLVLLIILEKLFLNIT